VPHGVARPAIGDAVTPAFETVFGPCRRVVATGVGTGQYACMVERPIQGRAAQAIAFTVAFFTLVTVNVVLFGWLYAPVMLAVEFTIIVFALLAASIIRSACCDRHAVPWRRLAADTRYEGRHRKTRQNGVVRAAVTGHRTARLHTWADGAERSISTLPDIAPPTPEHAK
jgi:hypothetical protein